MPLHAVLLALVMAALLAGGADSVSGRNLLVTACGGAAIVFLLSGRFGERAMRPPLLALTFGVPLLAAAQAVAAALGFGAAPLSAILDAAVLYLAYALFFLAALGALADLASIRAVAVGLGILGCAEAAYGVLNLLAGNEYLLFWPREAHHDSATGTLANRNHFAYLLEMTIPFAVAAMLLASPGRFSGRTRATEERARAALVMLGVALMLLGLLLSRSRMGLVSLAVASAATFALQRLFGRDRQTAAPEAGRRSALALAAVTALLLGGVGLDIAIERFAHASSDLEVGRVPIWRDSWTMFLGSPLLGNGLGSYELLISAYRSEPTGFSYGHAHCDYLELAAEGGLAALAVLAAWIALFFRRLATAVARPMRTQERMLTLAAATGILSVMLHSGMEFGLRIPAVALTLLLVVAVFIRLTDEPGAAT